MIFAAMTGLASAGEIGFSYLLPPAWTNVGEGVYGVNQMGVGPNGVLYAGGDFTNAGSMAVDAVAQWDGTNWSPMGAGMPYGEFNRWGVKALVVSPDGMVYAGGPFTNAGPAGANYLAQWNGTNWAKVGSGITDVAWSLAMATNGTLYASGWFTSAGGVPVNYIAQWNGTNWSALGSGFPAYDQYAQVLAAGPGSVLYAAGNFTTAGGVPAKRIAKWNGSSWSAMGSGIEGTVVTALAVAPNGDLYAGGLFTDAGGVAVNNIARWNGSSWSSVGDGLEGWVEALAFDTNGVLFAGGTFTNAGAVAVSRIAQWNGASWSSVEGGFSGGSATCYALAPAPNGDLYAAGGFITAGSATVNGMAKRTRVLYETSGVSPMTGSWTGGYPVVIEGPGLGDGSDITNVTLCGVAVSEISSQTSSGVVVTAGRAFAVGPGDVRVYSASLGETVGSNLFTYTGPGLKVLGTNGAWIANDAAPAKVDGTMFAHTLAGAEVTHTFQLSNADGTEVTTISGYDLQGAAFDVQAMPETLGAGGISNLIVRFAPPAAGNYSASLVISNDASSGIYTVRLAGAAYELSASAGPNAGGNVLTITNGYFGDITNVLVNGTSATMLESGDNWVRIMMPNSGGFTGTVDAVLQTSDEGEIFMPGIYTYNPRGVIELRPFNLPGVMMLPDDLDGANGARLSGLPSAGQMGIEVSGAGDVNDDGYDDFLLSSPYAWIGGVREAGEAYLVYGRTNGLPPEAMMTDTWLDGTNGVILRGSAVMFAYAGKALGAAGDVNGDGIDDFLVGVPGAGEAYLVYGRSGGYSALVGLTNGWANGANGVRCHGMNGGAASEQALAGVGDVNGDGFADFLVGSRSARPNDMTNAGAAYLIFGSDTALPEAIPMTNTWFNGTNGVMLTGAQPDIYCGTAVGPAGDVNGDGFADFLIGASLASPEGQHQAGEAYLVFGRAADQWPAVAMMTNTWLDGTNGMILAGRQAAFQHGSAVGAAGDVDGDGLDDFLVGTAYASAEAMTAAGEAYLIYGRTNAFPAFAAMDTNWLDGVNGALFRGRMTSARLGQGLNGARDMNGDGYADFALGAPGIVHDGMSYAGEAYVVYGTPDRYPALVMNTNAWLDGVNGSILRGSTGSMYVGWSVDFAGDVNGDTMPDLLVGALGVNNFTGAAYIVYGVPPVLAVDPPRGSVVGGYTVAIEGRNLGDGGDITNVTICGIDVTSIVSQTASSLVVIAAASPGPQVGDVIVYSTSYGETVKSNAFTYTLPLMEINGTNGAFITSGEAASFEKGGAFYTIPAGSNATHTFGITNGGSGMLHLSGWTTNGSGAAAFVVHPGPATVATGATASFSVTFSPPSAGQFDAHIIIANDSTNSAWELHVSGSAWALDNVTGPAGGGNTITITNGAMGTATNVLVDGIAAAIVDAGDSWVTITLPFNGTPGIKDIVIQTETGDLLLPSAYTYNPAGVIEGYLPAWDPRIALTNTTYDGDNGLIFAGAQENALMGLSVDSAGDVNGDGLDDALISFRQFLYYGGYRSGAFLVYGRLSGELPSVNMLTNTWLDGVNGLTIFNTNVQYGSLSGAAGDVNGDGYDDIVVGAPEGSEAGLVHLIFGGTNLPATIMLSNGWAHAANGVQLKGEAANDWLGWDFGGVGDVNGDGLADLAIGGIYNDRAGATDAGAVYLVYGRTNNWTSAITLNSEYLDGTNGIKLAGTTTNGYLGYHINQPGDVNQDGFNDLLLAYNVTVPPGATYLIYGGADLPPLITLSNDWFTGTNGTVFMGTRENTRIGRSANFCGDADGDGRTDLLLANELGAGLVFGRANFPAQVIYTNTWLEAGNGLFIKGVTGQYEPITGIGDINNDGLDDLGFGISSGQVPDGTMLVVFGRTNWPASPLELTTNWFDGERGVRFSSRGSYAAGSLGDAGDFNGDGVDDLLLSYLADSIYGHAGGGALYVHFGVKSVLAVDPPAGIGAGGYPVVIHGRNLGDGDDIYQVTLCGVAASIISQSATQVVVTAGPGAGPGDVRVFSTLFGETVLSNGFNYAAAVLQALGTNGVAIGSGAAATRENGTDFGYVPAGSSLSRSFRVHNAGPITLNISGWTTNTATDDAWTITGVPSVLAPGATSVVTVTFSPHEAGSFAAAFDLENDSPVSPFAFNVAGSAYAMSSLEGPLAGGNSVTFSNGWLGVITNVIVDGISVRPTASGDNWFTIVMPAPVSPGVKDIVIQTATGDVVIPAAYTFNPPGQIGSVKLDSTRWMEVEGMPQRLSGHASAEYAGSLYALGGTDGVTAYQTNVFRFNGTNWTQVAGLPAARRNLAAASLNGKLYAIGGEDFSGFYTNVYRYDGSVWTEVKGLPQARVSLSAAEFDGAIYTLGGIDNLGASTTNVFRYDGTNWTEVTGLPDDGRRTQAGLALFQGALYAVGGQRHMETVTNVYRFNGTSWTEVHGLPATKRGMGIAVADGELHVYGGYDGNSYVATSYRFNGSRWTNSAALPEARYTPGSGALNGMAYAFGGVYYSTYATNTFAYPAIVVDFGVSPVSGSWTGGYPVIITGSNLCNGSDVTSVTICGNPATVQSQTPTQVVVIAGAGLNPGLGDVRIYSASYGETVKSNGFTYIVTGPGLQVLDGAGVDVPTGAAASTAQGTRFPLRLSGQSATNYFSITNHGTAMMSITGFGVSDPAFRVDPGLFTALMPGATSRFYIAFAPQTAGDINATLVITNNSVASNYVINLAGSCIGLSRPGGPSAGGNEITIDNGDLTGVTNVTVGGVPVSVRTNSPTSITITIPTNLPAGPQTVVLESVDGSPLVLSNAYTINLPGHVGEYIVQPPVWTNFGSGLGGWVYALESHDGKLYAGGQFATGGMTNLAVWDGTSWSALGQPNGKVNAAVHAGGKLYIGGNFTAVGGVSANYIAMWNGVSWTNLSSGMNWEVKTLASDGTNVYAGGDFFYAGGLEAYRIAKWNGTAWSSIGVMGGTVYALLWSNGHLYAGGDFTTIGALSANRVARWNGVNWTNLGSGVSSTVRSLATDGTNLYSAGNFFSAGGVSAMYVAQWNGAAWTNMGAGMGQTVYSLSWGDGNLYAGGDFTTAGDVSAARVAQWNGQAWTNMSSGLNGSGMALDHDGRNLYAAGGFSLAGGISAVRVARWGSEITDRPGVEPASGGWDGGYPVTIYGANLADPADAISVTLCGVTATVVSVQGSTQLVVTAGASSVAGPGDVRVESESYGVTVKSNGFTYTPSGPSLTVLGTNGAAIASGTAADAAKGAVFPRLLAGTSATHRFAVTNDGTAAVTIHGFDISDDRFHVSGLPASLAAGAVTQFNVAFTPDMGGDFAAALVISNSGPTFAYTVNLSGSAIAFSATKGPSTGGNEITITNGNLSGVTNVMVGGIPATVRTNSDNTITIIIPTNSTPGLKDVVISGLPGGDLVFSNAYTINVPGRVGTAGTPARWAAMNNGLNGRVSAMAKAGTNLIAGGTFTAAQGQAANNLAIWNGAAWLPFPGGGTDASVLTILQDGGDTYIGGEFATAGGVLVNCVAKWNGSAWSSLGGGMIASMMPRVSKLAGRGTNLYACGSFTNAGGAAIEGLAMWNGNTWSKLGDGLYFNSYPGMVQDICYADGYLYACGTFNVSGATALNNLARWNGSVWENVNSDSLFRPQKIYHDGTHLYAQGSMNTPPYDSKLRRLDDGVWTDIGTGGVESMATLGSGLCVGGAFTSMGGVAVTNVAVFDGSMWTGLGQGLGNNMAFVMTLFHDGDTLFAGGSFTNAGPDDIKYAAQWLPAAPGESGVTPALGSSAGGTVVTITGENLGDGTDVTNVTLCGVSVASIVSQSSTQIVVVTGSGSPGIGDVRVYSTSFGESVSENAFTYSGAQELVLTIQSAHGTGAPVTGIYTQLAGAVLTNRMSSPDTQGATQFVCAGWTMTGHEPASGTGTEVIFTLTNNATLTWLWTTNYWLAPTSGPNGSIDRVAGWRANGEVVVITATADPYYHFTIWTGSVSSDENPLQLTMSSALEVMANFAPDTTSNGVPVPWLVRFGITNNFEEESTRDSDGDGIPNDQEYVADTNPTNAQSFFGLGEFSPVYSTNCYDVVYTNTEPPYEVSTQTVCDVVDFGLSMPASADRVYDVQYTFNVQESAWTPAAGQSNLVPVAGRLVITNLLDSSNRKFYRVGVRLP